MTMIIRSAFEVWEMIPHKNKENIAHLQQWVHINDVKELEIELRVQKQKRNNRMNCPKCKQPMKETPYISETYKESMIRWCDECNEC